MQVVPNWKYLGYYIPEDCILLDLQLAKLSQKTKELCSDELRMMDDFKITYDNVTVSKMTHCEISLNMSQKNLTETCSDASKENTCKNMLTQASACKRWSVAEWLLTPYPGVFGLIKGYANITGVLLIFVLTIIVICSLPHVRRSGHFQVNLSILKVRDILQKKYYCSKANASLYYETWSVYFRYSIIPIFCLWCIWPC